MSWVCLPQTEGTKCTTGGNTRDRNGYNPGKTSFPGHGFRLYCETFLIVTE
jgi:hypothetical protein